MLLFYFYCLVLTLLNYQKIPLVTQFCGFPFQIIRFIDNKFWFLFQVWNSVGIIVQYNTDEENSINVEFHDTAVHHSIHITNTLNHTMATLSDEAVLLACETDEETPRCVYITVSQLQQNVTHRIG